MMSYRFPDGLAKLICVPVNMCFKSSVCALFLCDASLLGEALPSLNSVDVFIGFV